MSNQDPTWRGESVGSLYLEGERRQKSRHWVFVTGSKTLHPAWCIRPMKGTQGTPWRISWQRHDAEAHLLYRPLILSWSFGTMNMMLVTSSSHCKHSTLQHDEGQRSPDRR